MDPQPSADESPPSTAPRGNDDHRSPPSASPEKKTPRPVGRPRGSGKPKIAKDSEEVFEARLQALSNVHTKNVSTEDVRVFIGHASWHPGQLEEEIQVRHEPCFVRMFFFPDSLFANLPLSTSRVRTPI